MLPGGVLPIALALYGLYFRTFGEALLARLFAEICDGKMKAQPAGAAVAPRFPRIF